MGVGALSQDATWILLSSFLVALMQAGFTCLESGFVREKNSINVAIKNLVDFCISGILFAVLGYQIMFGQTTGGWFGSLDPVSMDTQAPDKVAFFIFQLMFCGTAATIISGAVSERMRFSGYIAITMLTAGLFYPVAGHWVWNGLPGDEATGWLGQLGFVDFAGSTVVHSVGGWIALSAILIIGPRIGRFGPNGRRIEGHNLPMAVLGVFLLWFGFFGFNGGSTLALNESVPRIVMNTALAGAAGGLAGMALSWAFSRHPQIDRTVNGVVAGLVSICAGCHLVGEREALLIGLCAGIIVVGAMWLLEKAEIDDVIGAVPAHLAAGIWGTLAVALFAPIESLPAGSVLGQLKIQALGVFAIGIFAFGSSYVLFWLIDRVLPFRVTAADERVGLNVAEHRATTSILDLITQMDHQTRHGDFSRPVVVEPETEASRIALFYNAVLERFHTETRRRHEALERMVELANSDALTGLANRRRFFDDLERTVARVRHTRRFGALFYIDLDGFKPVNDTYGHEVGDTLLKQVAQRLLAMARQTDGVARLGGDEFAFLATAVDDTKNARNLAQKIIATLSEPFMIEGLDAPVTIGASVGFTVFGGEKANEAEWDAEAIVRRADDAMYDAKLAGKGTWRMALASDVVVQRPLG
jgi:ammonium transporter, Amt family